MATTDLARLLDKHKSEVGALSQDLLDGKTEAFVADTSQLLASIASGVPALGVLAKQGVAKLFALSSYAVLKKELDALGREEERQAFAEMIASPIEELIGQALIQLVRVQNRGNDQVIEELGGLRAEFEAFRSEFGRRLTEATVTVELIDVTEGVGIRVSSRTTKTITATAIKVQKGTGIILD